MNGVSEKFKYFVTYLRQNCINNKYDAINMFCKIYDKNSYIECNRISMYILDHGASRGVRLGGKLGERGIVVRGGNQ